MVTIIYIITTIDHDLLHIISNTISIFYSILIIFTLK